MSDGAHFRRTARQPVELSVRFRRDADDAALVWSAKLLDLGLGGAQLRCERPPEVGARVRLTLAAPTAWDPLELGGEVRWVEEAAEGPAFGLAFDALTPAQASALYELLAVSRFAGAAQ
ncbi:MAG: PilZ domain-containing protein [Sandaracinaceae bacterium]|nr:PilZ domain-containing protein [Sandaracinaceae bacterium]